MNGAWRVVGQLGGFLVLSALLVGCGSEQALSVEDTTHASTDIASEAVSDVELTLPDTEAVEADIGPGSSDDSGSGSDSSDEADSGGDADVEGADVEGADVEGADVEGDAEGEATDVGAPISSYPELPATLSETVAEKMVAAKVPGLSACIVKDDAIFWCGGFGGANLENDVPATEHTPFLLASISKLFTSTVVLQLVESGELDLEADVSGLLGWELTHPMSDAPITMSQLLTHTSGLKDNWSAMGDFYGYGSDPELSLKEAIEGYFQTDGFWYDAGANFTSDGPGEGFLYSNMAVALAAYIVEQVTGQDFVERSQETLLGPLGLTQSAWRLSAFPDLDALAMPYKWQGGEYVPTGHYTFADYPNGGLRASAHDLARFLVAHLRGGELDGERVLSQESVDAALSVQVAAPSKGQGWMWYQLSWGGDDWWGHSGAENGVWTEVFFRESDKMGFVTLTNGDANDPNPVYAIQDALLLWAETYDGP
ncbi:MAG: serine hydrolase domain-containing protein [Myxococcota bacterium]